MSDMNQSNKIPLYGFNNLTKNLSFSLYKLHYIHQENQLEQYNAYISSQYNSEKLSQLLSNICHAIGGNVLNIASQDYQPHGASVTLMISEEAQPEPLPPSATESSLAESLVAHLDKSHLCIHTYPDEHSVQKGKIVTFRADIELSTCGVISPLKVLNYVINEFNADVIDVDYRIRGMTRNLQGEMQFIDQEIEQISDYLSTELLLRYHIENNTLANKNLFHMRMCRKEATLSDNVFAYKHGSIEDLSTEERHNISLFLQNEMQQIFCNTIS